MKATQMKAHSLIIIIKHQKSFQAKYACHNYVSALDTLYLLCKNLLEQHLQATKSNLR